jgi:hypothetical protein
VHAPPKRKLDPKGWRGREGNTHKRHYSHACVRSAELLRGGGRRLRGGGRRVGRTEGEGERTLGWLGGGALVCQLTHPSARLCRQGKASDFSPPQHLLFTPPPLPRVIFSSRASRWGGTTATPERHTAPFSGFRCFRPWGVVAVARCALKQSTLFGAGRKKSCISLAVFYFLVFF